MRHDSALLSLSPPGRRKPVLYRNGRTDQLDLPSRRLLFTAPETRSGVSDIKLRPLKLCLASCRLFRGGSTSAVASDVSSVRATTDEERVGSAFVFGCLRNSSRCVVRWVGRIAAGRADGDRRRHGSAEGGHRPGPRGEWTTEDAAGPARITRRQTADQCTIRYDTIRDDILTRARKPTRVSLIYRTEPTTKK